MRVLFFEPPPQGFGIVIDGQEFRLRGYEPHTKIDGSRTVLGLWVSDCAECGSTFTTKTPSLSAPDSRRCPKHKAPGKRVVRQLALNTQLSPVFHPTPEQENT
jgi:hypothetical protein